MDFISNSQFPVLHHAKVLLAAFFSLARSLVLETVFDGEVHGLCLCEAELGRLKGWSETSRWSDCFEEC